jgi:hypothetical protein
MPSDVSIQTAIIYEKPAMSVWKSFLPLFAKAQYRYRNMQGAYEWRDFSVVSVAPTQNRQEATSLEMSDIKKSVRAHQEEISACHLRFAAELSGIVEINYVIDDEGRVIDAGIKQDTIRKPKVSACLCEVFRKIKFPANLPGEQTSWAYTLQFGA